MWGLKAGLKTAPGMLATMKVATIPQPLTRARPAERTGAAQYRAIHDPLVQIVVPVLNEAATLHARITKLQQYLAQHVPYRHYITIADNGSQDGTRAIARQLAVQHSNVHYVSLTERGRGRALRHVWQASRADIISYMDVDLSTSLDDFMPMITPLITGEAGVAIGSRLAKGARTMRGLKREFISRCYNEIIKLTSGTTFRDAQCGFKALRRDVAQQLLPRVKDNEWFFDTELLIKAERAGVPIHQQPVTWVEDTDSRVKIVKTALDDLKGLHRVNKEHGHQPVYQRWVLPLVLVATGALYAWGALQNGMANSYYAAAVQAASQDWTAWLFGSLDAANYVSIDKPPLATMLMGLSARIFGFHSLSMLLPSVLAGVGSVWLLYAAVKRQFGWGSATSAAVTLALTPVAALMFGFNNPDAILTLMLIASAYSFLRALEGTRPYLWMGVAALLTGLAFNTKMLQGLMVLPAMLVVYLACAQPPVVVRLVHMLYAGVVTALGTLWWSVLVWLTPAANRPWVGSTNNNNIWSLIFGYNGLGRLLGGGAGHGGPGGATPPAAAQSMSQAVGHMAPPAMAGGGGHGPGGAGFGGETGLLRIFNSDFGPNIAWLLVLAVVGGGLMLWILRKAPRNHRGRAAVIFWLLWLLTHTVIFSITSGVIHPYYVVVMAPAVAALVGISVPFLWGAYTRRKAYAWLLPAVVGITALVAAIIIGYAGTMAWLMWLVLGLGLVAATGLTINLYNPQLWLQRLAAGGAILACVLAPITYTVATVNQTHTGSIPTAGPSATAMKGSNNEQATAEASLVTYLLKNRAGATWLAATASANESAALQLTSGQPVMAVGGFNGSDTPLTLSQFKQLVREGKVKYYAASSKGPGGGYTGRMQGGPGGNNEISQWVQRHGTVVNYGGNSVALYKLSQA